MSTDEMASASMQRVISALKSSELERLDELSSIEEMLALLEKVPKTGWHAAYSDLHRRWKEREADVLAIEAANRKALKL